MCCFGSCFLFTVYDGAERQLNSVKGEPLLFLLLHIALMRRNYTEDTVDDGETDQSLSPTINHQSKESSLEIKGL